MYLKQLDIQGFKSFPDKVRLNFKKGITTVVGPNGSGKSNISDSVRWVLGEQKAKSLRGDKMEDVIFAGTQNRKPLGFAEVSITIDNQDYKMPIAYTEVTVTRRVFRSGESEYQINGTNCRLKDIHELFMDTGVGKEGYSIIGQGRIDEILNAKGDDRRRLFEEATGIGKHKTRKFEAQTRMERERENLTRVEDIIQELYTQVEPLQVQSETAKKYLSLKEKLKSAEAELFCIQIEKQQDSWQTAEEQKKAALSQAEQEENLYKNEKQKSGLLQQEISVLEEKIQRVNETIVEHRTRIEKEEGRERLAEEQILQIKREIDRLQKETGRKEEKKEENKKEISLCQSRLDASGLTFLTAKQRLEKQEEVFQKLSGQLTQEESQVEEYKSEMIEKIRVTTEIKEKISRTQAMLEQFSSREQQLTEEKEHLQSQMEDAQIHGAVIEKKIKNCMTVETKLKQERETTEAEKQKLTEAMEQNRLTARQKNSLLTEMKSRYKLLSEMEKEHEGFFKSVKMILKQRESGNPRFSGIHGAVGELLHVKKSLETAIEVALGGSLQNIVTEKEEDAKAAIAFLKEKNGGRATFLPLSAVKGRPLGKERDVCLQEKGMIGIAKELVQFDARYDGIMASLLGRVFIAETIEDAIAFSRKYKYAYKVVTLEGDILNPGGSMTGGSVMKKTSNVFGRTREIKELRQKIAEETELFQKLEQTLQKQEKVFSDCTSRLGQLQENFKNLEIEKQLAEQERKQTYALIETQKEKLSHYQVEEKQLKEQIEEVDTSLRQARDRLVKKELEMQEIDEKLAVFQDSMEEDKKKKDACLAEMTETRILLSSQEQNQSALQETMQRLQKETALLKEEILQGEQEVKKNLLSVAQKKQEIEKIHQSAKEVSEEVHRQQKELTVLGEEKKHFHKQVSDLEESLQNRLHVASALKNEVFRLETKLERLSEEKQRIIDAMWDEYELTYQLAKEIPKTGASFPQLTSQVKQLRTEIRELGSVNVDAIEKYKQVKERLEFLTAQREDIIEAEKRLEAVISELTRLMEEQFKEQFSFISENFEQVFQEMFGGGKAYLKLSDEENVLESNIEIIAQPPGKTLQSMMLLSGGERALTAIAILFSILKLKPSPFCILDEIEAALDDANVKRYANYLKKFSGDTQFIVITHRKGTMESADVMYGVTMQEQGVSKLISVKFEEEAV